MIKKECIIVGSGLAGVSLAWELHKRNVDFVMIGCPNLSRASMIAPGVWNPIVFKRLNPTWNATQLLNDLLPFYQYVEEKVQHSLIIPMKMWHVINNENEANLWKNKRDLYPRFLQEIIWLNVHQNKYLRKDLRVGEVNNCGRLNVSEYIHYSIEYFKSVNCFSENIFHYDLLFFDHFSVEYENIQARYIVFCEGYLVKNNPYFCDVRLQPAKGEIIEIETDSAILPENTILHKNISIVPSGKNRYFIGSNYEWDKIDEQPTSEMKAFFLSVFENIFNVDYQIIGHYAGIRPAADRKPIIGSHPQFKNILILNGLGTKGVMLAPWSAKVLVDYMFNQASIPHELSCERLMKV